jgi:spore maturation protein SpmA
VLNYIWLALVLLAVAIGGWNDRFKEVTEGALDGAKTAVTIALGLIGIMALWLGVMRLAERAGLVQRIARGLRPIMRRLFPDVLSCRDLLWSRGNKTNAACGPGGFAGRSDGVIASVICRAVL